MPGYAARHECGHKLLNQPKEAGEVFAFELRKIREIDGIPAARKWVMGGPPGRTPGYFREYGLKIDPGKRDLLLELKAILPEDDFFREFGEQYAAIMGTAPKEKEAEKESASGSISVGRTIEGKIAELRKLVPEEDIKGGTRGDIVPKGAGRGETVKFAGKRWKILNKTEDFPVVWTLQCTSLTEFSGPVQVGTVFAYGTDQGTTYGLTMNGPWVYANLSSAQKDYNVWYVVKGKVMKHFKEADDAVVDQLILEYLTKSAGKQS